MIFTRVPKYNVSFVAAYFLHCLQFSSLGFSFFINLPFLLLFSLSILIYTFITSLSFQQQSSSRFDIHGIASICLSLNSSVMEISRIKQTAKPSTVRFQRTILFDHRQGTFESFFVRCQTILNAR
jgi:hypothetical protein